LTLLLDRPIRFAARPTQHKKTKLITTLLKKQKTTFSSSPTLTLLFQKSNKFTKNLGIFIALGLGVIFAAKVQPKY